MELTISGRHVAVTDGMREHARARAGKIERITHHLMRLQITLAVEGDRHMAEAVAATRGKGELVAKAVTHDMYVSIDQVISKIEKQLQKLEARVKNRRDGAREKRFEGVGPEDSSEPGEDEEKE